MSAVHSRYDQTDDRERDEFGRNRHHHPDGHDRRRHDHYSEDRYRENDNRRDRHKDDRYRNDEDDGRRRRDRDGHRNGHDHRRDGHRDGERDWNDYNDRRGGDHYEDRRHKGVRNHYKDERRYEDDERAEEDRRHRHDERRNERQHSLQPPVDFEDPLSLEAGIIVRGHVSRIEPYGAFIDFTTGRDRHRGLAHISQLAEGRVGHVEEVVQMNQPVFATVLEVQDMGNQRPRIRLGLKEVDQMTGKKIDATTSHATRDPVKFRRATDRNRMLQKGSMQLA